MVDNQPAAPPRQGKGIAELHAVLRLNGFPAIRKMARNIQVIAKGFSIRSMQTGRVRSITLAPKFASLQI